MIGVIANDADAPVAREFFELFKTPWEHYQPERAYDVVLICGGDTIPADPVKILVHYSASCSVADCDQNAEIHIGGRNLVYKGQRIPTYGSITTFPFVEAVLITDEVSSRPVGYQSRIRHSQYCRIGYDLFGEIKALLTNGQPPEHAGIPTVELHIELLRDVMIAAGVTFIEVPPVPEGFSFIACLTHDVDHPAIRFHKWDHTLFGFLYRALWDSFFQVLKGRRPLSHLWKNYVAVAKVPFVHLGLVRDFWYEFNRYRDLEDGSTSTYFVLPFKGRPGLTASGQAPSIRASSYGAEDIADKLGVLITSGMEIGLHGIDAWIDDSRGREERAQIAMIANAECHGVRMHWLYFNDDSYEMLEKSGFAYDSTIGYNETIGYRAGTTQVYKPLQTKQLLELPLHVMDTALFYPAHLNLSFDDAARKIRGVVHTTALLGGVVTFNWHDRSIAPERGWGQFYARLIRDLKEKGSWCTNASNAVSWFQDRRSVCFTRTDQGVEVTRAAGQWRSGKDSPSLRVRVYNSTHQDGSCTKEYVESSLYHDMTIDREGVVSECRDCN